MTPEEQAMQDDLKLKLQGALNALAECEHELVKAKQPTLAEDILRELSHAWDRTNYQEVGEIMKRVNYMLNPKTFPRE